MARRFLAFSWSSWLYFQSDLTGVHLPNPRLRIWCHSLRSITLWFDVYLISQGPTNFHVSIILSSPDLILELRKSNNPYPTFFGVEVFFQMFSPFLHMLVWWTAIVFAEFNLFAYSLLCEFASTYVPKQTTEYMVLTWVELDEESIDKSWHLSFNQKSLSFEGCQVFLFYYNLNW